MRLVILIILLSFPAFALVEIPDTYLMVRPGQNLWFQHDGADTAVIRSGGIDVGSWKVDPLESSSHLLLPTELREGEYLLVLSGQGMDMGSAHFNVSLGKTVAHDVIEASLFDIIVDIPLAYKQVAPGGELISTTKLINLGSKGRVDVFMDYWITDSSDRSVMKRRETVAVETQANFVKTFAIPDSLTEGDYCLHSRITYADGKIAEAGNCFKIAESSSNRLMNGNYFIYSIVAIVGGLVAFMVIRKVPFDMISVRMRVRSIVNRKFKR